MKQYARTYQAILWNGNIQQLEEFVNDRLLRIEFSEDESLIVIYGKDWLSAKHSLKTRPGWMIFKQHDGRIDSCSVKYFIEIMGCEEVK